MHSCQTAGLAFLALVATGISTRAQQPAAPTPTITVNAQLVNLPVIVRDRKGALVQNLNQADFTLNIDGHPQTIRYFDKDNDLPLTLGLLVDTSGSVRSELDVERIASQAFLDQLILDQAIKGQMIVAPANRAPDQAFLIQFAHETDLLQDLTPSRPKLRAALNQVGVEDRDSQDQNNNGGAYGHHHGGFHGGGTTLYDAIFLLSLIHI